MYEWVASPPSLYLLCCGCLFCIKFPPTLLSDCKNKHLILTYSKTVHNWKYYKFEKSTSLKSKMMSVIKKQIICYKTQKDEKI